jgi:hypothetical protein
MPQNHCPLGDKSARTAWVGDENGIGVKIAA